MLALALVDVAEAALQSGGTYSAPDPSISDPEMDLDEPIYLHLQVSSEIEEVPSGVLTP